ncbi:deoxynucleoside kinase [Kosmotoga pacifica]|uniref:Deoxycytidine kinase n=1 Tax=Kosmotoga pacifica TaxID=1330330 RepID=A0A0G2Z970_9BACT|nr:deoxynucleoside kinase [Kosmotoga pacifica]AKI98107.1 deoxycytidine kinase [Kosmotoga pacifica]
MDCKIIVFAGNVGAGKSTLARAVGKQLGFEIFYESVVDNPFLEDFYYDQKKWAYHLQTYFLVHRFSIIKEAEIRKINAVFDRSIYEDAAIFARNLYETGKMGKREFETYIHMFNSMMRYIRHPDLLVYVDADVDTILSRIRRRGRQMELEVPIAYWQQLDNLYKKWIKEYDFSPIYTIDATKIDIVSNPDQINDVVNDIRDILGI